MNYDLSIKLYLLAYIVTIIYFVLLGCYMLAQRSNPFYTRGEREAKERLTRTVGASMLVWAFDLLIYLPPILFEGDFYSTSYDICFLVTLMLDTPLLYMVMHAIVQKKVNTVLWTTALGMPFLLLCLCYIFLPELRTSNLPINIARILNVILIVVLLIRYSGEYKNYVRRIRSEYSETTRREIFWSWSCFAGFAAQALVFILYHIYWRPVLDVMYGVISITNGTYLCYCTCRQKTLDNDIVEENIDENERNNTLKEQKDGEKAFYAIIEQRLESLCEEKLLFLDPDLTRETLCLRLSIGRTYLSMYLSSRNLTFYQYINTLRIDYAVKLLQENPDMPIRDVCELSGFRSQTTFRKVFKDVMGCLPSDIKNIPTN